MTAFAELTAFHRETEALSQISGRLGWDQETVMPAGAADQRGEEFAALEGVIHARRTDPRLGEWLAKAEAQTPVEAAMLRQIGRSYAQSTLIPARLATELARITSLAQTRWVEAREAEDVASFLPTLAEVIALRREEGAALAQGGDPYDALLDTYEEGMTSAELTRIFSALRPGLVALRGDIAAAKPIAPLTGAFNEAGQMRLAQKVALAFGYDFKRGRLDKSVHPFSSGSGADVRITTRVDEADPFNCLYSTIHEVGHACYEQNIAPDYALTALGGGVSMGVHESQSRIYENNLARSEAFTGWLFNEMRAEFGAFGVADPQAFYRLVNRVESGFIRTEADEVHYNLHIMLRFDLEQALMRGTLEVADLEEAWNTRFLADFGLAVSKPSEGVLQDVHWPAGLFGYFPTYALGNIYAANLHEAMMRDGVPLDALLAEGRAAEATAWLTEKVQRHGALYAPQEVITKACGTPIDPEALLRYLNRKYRAIYDC